MPFNDTVNLRQRTAQMLAKKRLETPTVVSDNSTPTDMPPGGEGQFTPTPGGGWTPAVPKRDASLPGEGPSREEPKSGLEPWELPAPTSGAVSSHSPITAAPTVASAFDTKRAGYTNGRPVNAAGQFLDSQLTPEQERQQTRQLTPIQSRLKQLATTRAKIQMTRGI